MLFTLLFPLFLLFPSVKYDHAIYISVLEINNKQMKVKVFADNLEDAMRNDSNSMEGYFRSKIKLRINEQIMGFSLEEVTLEGDSYWITFKLEAQEPWHSFHLEASYLMELFPNQINVIKVMGEKPQFFRLTKFNPSCDFTL